MNFSWLLPSFAKPSQDKSGSLDHVDFMYLSSVAQTAEQHGFDSLLVPVDSGCLDPFIVSTYILQHTKRIRALIALRTGFIEPVYATRMISTLSRLSQGRIDLNIVSGSSRSELEKEGGYLDHEARYRRTREFLAVSKGLMLSPYLFSYEGEFYCVKNASLTPVLEREPLIYVAGSSVSAKRVALEFGDVYLMFGDERYEVDKHIRKIRDLKNEQGLGRSLCIGLRLNVVLRDTRDEAFAVIKQLQNVKGKPNPRRLRFINMLSDSEGQKRMNALALEENSLRDECLYTGLIDGQSGGVPMLVGSPSDICDAIQRYMDLGITHFIFSTPCSDCRGEIKRFGNDVISHFRNQFVGV